MTAVAKAKVVDPLHFVSKLWPDIYLYDKQRELLYSLWNNDETYCPAGNMLGKDYIGALGALSFFLTRTPCRIFTTSVKDSHLDVLWGEMMRFIRSAAYPLDVANGGDLIINHRHIRKMVFNKMSGAREECPLSKIKGEVAESEASYQGYHIAETGDGIPRNLLVVDEASGVDDLCYRMGSTWARRIFVIGNPWPCSNFFYRAVEGSADGVDAGGDIPRPGGGFYRKVIPIGAKDSPNVRYAFAEIAAGREPSHEILVPGVKPYGEYLKNLRMWDAHQQCVSLDGQFYKGADAVLFPQEWLTIAEKKAQELGINRKSIGRTYMGVDSAMGGDNTTFAIGNDLGLLDLRMSKTPKTSDIMRMTIAYMIEFDITPEDVLFDAGGGGQVHADFLRQAGHEVRVVGFGESVAPLPRSWMTTTDERIEQREEKYTFKNRRAEMYGLLRQRLNPSSQEIRPYALPRSLLLKARQDGGPTLYRQLTCIPLWYDEEGRLYLPPKQRKPDASDASKNKPTMNKLLGGYSPDEADALVLMHYGMFSDPVPVAG